ncbi:hypothetical protein CDAR_516821 [Caerostris darwini]|uniref:Uncharacterized protein n=1 Tax=Caerostris darwini TaxID=1538125 RepID=A0AAV4UE09_9ARAC|nr:hypothetical protein CDAR_516821 [Caerostris darwini]
MTENDITKAKEEKYLTGCEIEIQERKPGAPTTPDVPDSNQEQDGDKERLTHVYLVDDGVVYKEAFHRRNNFRELEQRIMEQRRAEAEREAAAEEESDINSNDVGLKDNMHDNQD